MRVTSGTPSAGSWTPRPTGKPPRRPSARLALLLDARPADQAGLVDEEGLASGTGRRSRTPRSGARRGWRSASAASRSPRKAARQGCVEACRSRRDVAAGRDEDGVGRPGRASLIPRRSSARRCRPRRRPRWRSGPPSAGCASRRPAGMALVEAPRRTSSVASPRRPECDETLARPARSARALIRRLTWRPVRGAHAYAQLPRPLGGRHVSPAQRGDLRAAQARAERERDDRAVLETALFGGPVRLGAAASPLRRRGKRDERDGALERGNGKYKRDLCGHVKRDPRRREPSRESKPSAYRDDPAAGSFSASIGSLLLP